MIVKTASGKVICQDLKLCEGFVDRMLGLLKSSNPRNLLFKTRFGIHTFFLSEPIDVVILDQDMQIVKIKKDLLTNTLFFWNPLFDHVLEFKKGTISKHELGLGDLVVIK